MRGVRVADLTMPVRNEDLPLLWAGIYRFPPDGAAEIGAAIGQRVAFRLDGPSAEDVGHARIAGVRIADADTLVAELDELSFAPWPDVPMDRVLSDRFPYPAGSGGEGFEEAATPLIESIGAAAQAAKRNYGYRCAISHHRFSEEDSLAEDLAVVVIQPLPEGGRLHVTNLLPIALPFVEPFTNGRIVVAADFSIFTSGARLAPEIAAAVHPSGRLLVPDDPTLQPDRAALAAHARRFVLQE